MSRRSETSSPIRWSVPEQQGHVLLSTSMTLSIRGRWAGKAPRLVRRLATRAARVRRRILGCGKPGRLDLLGLLQPEQELVGRQGLRAAPEAMALQLLDNQAKALALGTLGQHHRLEQAWVVRKQMRRRAHESK